MLLQEKLKELKLAGVEATENEGVGEIEAGSSGVQVDVIERAALVDQSKGYVEDEGDQTVDMSGLFDCQICRYW